MENEPLRSKDTPGSRRKFFVILTGKTNGAHKPVVKTFKSLGQTEVDSPDDADYFLVFCPVASRVGTDVSDAMERLPLQGDKEAVLVVMHHTFNRDQVIPPSSRLVHERRVRLTLDCLFYRNDLLRCELNDKMKTGIKKFFGSSIPNPTDPKPMPHRGGSGTSDRTGRHSPPGQLGPLVQPSQRNVANHGRGTLLDWMLDWMGHVWHNFRGCVCCIGNPRSGGKESGPPRDQTRTERREPRDV